MEQKIIINGQEFDINKLLGMFNQPPKNNLPSKIDKTNVNKIPDLNQLFKMFSQSQIKQESKVANPKEIIQTLDLTPLVKMFSQPQIQKNPEPNTMPPADLNMMFNTLKHAMINKPIQAPTIERKPIPQSEWNRQIEKRVTELEIKLKKINRDLYE